MDKVPERLLIELMCLFFMMNSSVLLNVFYSVDLEIWPSYECFNLQVSSFFIKSYCCYAPIVILHFFWSNLTHVSALKLLKSLKISALCLFLLTERKGPNWILSLTFVILDGSSVTFSTFDACVIEKTFYRILRLDFVKVNDFNEQ